MLLEEFRSRTGKLVPSEEYHDWIEPLYMESELEKDDFCRLFKEGAFKVRFPTEAEQTAYSSALDWGLDWRKARDTIRILTRIAKAHTNRFSEYGLSYEINDDNYDISDSQLTNLQDGRDLYTVILDDLASWGGKIWYGKSVVWGCPNPARRTRLEGDMLAQALDQAGDHVVWPLRRCAMNPWEMTRAEYREQDSAFLKANANLDAARAAMGGNDRWGESRRFAGRSAGFRLGRLDKARERWSRTWDRVESRHRKEVERALSKRLPVPEVVLAEYPDLGGSSDVAGPGL